MVFWNSRHMNTACSFPYIRPPIKTWILKLPRYAKGKGKPCCNESRGERLPILSIPGQVSNWLVTFPLEVLDVMLQNLTVHNLSGRQLPPGVSRFFGLGKSFIPIPTSAKPTPFYEILHTVKQLHRAVKVRKVVDPKGKNSFVYDKFKLRSNFDPVDKCPISSLFLQGITSELSQNSANFNALVAARQVRPYSNVPRHVAENVIAIKTWGLLFCFLLCTISSRLITS